MTAHPHLHFSELRPEQGKPERALLFLHGILGTGANLRGLAQRFLRADASWLAVLVDLRGHGRSPDFAPPHDLAACAHDLAALEREISLPVAGVIGHSFGGKVALAYHVLRPDLTRVALLDSAPSARPERAGSEETHAVLDLLERAPTRFESRQQFSSFVHENGHSRAIADWLAMNLLRGPDGFRVRTNVPLIRTLLDDYFTRDMWSVVEQSRARVDIVIAGRSEVFGPEDIARAEQLGGDVHAHRIAKAGHWVHADAADETARALTT
jgi:pimeloyl-ACP methyl ester carboxylesterase